MNKIMIIDESVILLLYFHSREKKNSLPLHCISAFLFCCAQVKKRNQKLATIHTQLFEKHWIREFLKVRFSVVVVLTIVQL